MKWQKLFEGKKDRIVAIVVKAYTAFEAIKKAFKAIKAVYKAIKAAMGKKS